MQTAINFVYAKEEKIPIRDRGESCAFGILTAIRPEVSRIISIGGSALLFENLLKSGYKVAHINDSQELLHNIGTYISTYCWAKRSDFESLRMGRGHLWLWKGKIELGESDCILFLRKLHHLEEAERQFKECVEILPSGSWVVICDTSVDLMEQRRVRDEGERKQFLQVLPDSEKQKWQEEWARQDTYDAGCVDLLKKTGLAGEKEVREFLIRVGMDNTNFWYAPSCPCPDLFCPEITMYWFAAWRKSESIVDKKAA